MNIKRRRRLSMVIILVVGVSMAAALALYALGQNVDLYYTPTQLLNDKVPADTAIRLGGMVVNNSVQRMPNSLQVSFALTDYQHQRQVKFNGILPALFREGQGIVVQGKLDKAGVLVADQVLAKHDNQYMPPGLNPKQKATG